MSKLFLSGLPQEWLFPTTRYRGSKRKILSWIWENINGLEFETDLATGHKTGLYLDQQVNYQRVSEFAAGAQVLDCFSFLGGFGLHAARSGAAHVHMLDQSADAIAAATRNAARNGLGDVAVYSVIEAIDAPVQFLKGVRIWFLPACDTLLGWLRKTGFVDCRLVDVSATSTDEQRSTDWMRFQSLADFLDPADHSKTVESYPAPRRAIVIARAAA